MLLCWAGPALGLDTLIVGRGTASLRWTVVEESSAFLGVAVDSIWTWGAEPGANLARQVLARRGRIGIRAERQGAFGVEQYLVERSGLLAWLDGDQDTAWGPDEDEEIERQVEIYLDLGGTFRVDRIRLHPRLDSEHRDLILGAFELATGDGTEPPDRMLEASYRMVVGFSTFYPNKVPVVDRWFPVREVRYLRLRSLEGQPWEIAELEMYGDGSVPTGEFVSQPLFVRGGFPVWGRVLADGTEVAALPLVIQTRTGPDAEPLHYYLKRGDELEQVSEADYRSAGAGSSFSGFLEEEQGPVLANPAWSPWQTVTDGLVLSPSPRRYLQFRILLPEAGTAVGRLAFEYVGQPLARELAAEVSPLVVKAGEETEFALSLEVQIDPGRGDTGVRYLEVLTPAVVHEVSRVLVDDAEVVFTPLVRSGEGFLVDLWERVVQSGSFVQLFFRASVFRDGTSFQVRALDLRVGEGGIESVYQMAREGDVDPLSVGGQLVVRLEAADQGLIGAVRPRNRIFSPNGDGLNEVFEVSFGLLKLTAPAQVFFEIFALDGRRVRQGQTEAAGSGQFVRLWDGRDDGDEPVRPGLYLYQIRAETDSGPARWQGTVGVAY